MKHTEESLLKAIREQFPGNRVAYTVRTTNDEPLLTGTTFVNALRDDDRVRGYDTHSREMNLGGGRKIAVRATVLEVNVATWQHEERWIDLATHQISVSLITNEDTGQSTRTWTYGKWDQRLTDKQMAQAAGKIIEILEDPTL